MSSDDIFVELKPKGFIKYFLDEVKTDIPESSYDWVLSCAESLLSSCCYNQHTDNEKGKLYLALWNLAIAPSGENKTVILKYFLFPIIEYVEKNLDKPLLVGSLTVEGFIKYMTFHSIEIFNEDTEEKSLKWFKGNVGLFAKDEITSFIEGQKTKSFMTGLSEFLSKVYDTKIIPRITVTHDRQNVPYCNYSLVSATTRYIYEIIEKRFFIQGLGNRLDFSVFGKQKKVIKLSPKFFETAHKEKRKRFIERMGDLLISLIKGKLTFVGYSPEAQKLWIEYDYDIKRRKAKMNDTDLCYSFLNRQAEKALRRACVYCISRNIEGIKNHNPANLLVSVEDMKLAIQRQKIIYEYFLKLLEEWDLYKGGDQDEERSRSSKRELVEYLRVIQDSRGTISAKEIRSKLNITDKRKVKGVLDLGTDKGWLEHATDVERDDFGVVHVTRGSLTNEEYLRFKPKRGKLPIVWRITKKGKEIVS